MSKVGHYRSGSHRVRKSIVLARTIVGIRSFNVARSASLRSARVLELILTGSSVDIFALDIALTATKLITVYWADMGIDGERTREVSDIGLDKETALLRGCLKFR